MPQAGVIAAVRWLFSRLRSRRTAMAAASPFPAPFVKRAFRASDGELGWTREDARLAIRLLAARNFAILSGQLWWVPEGGGEWIASIPLRDGVGAVYSWSTKRRHTEQWAAYVARCRTHSLNGVSDWQALSDLPPDARGTIVCYLYWMSEADFG